MNYEENPTFTTSDGKTYYGYKDIQKRIRDYLEKHTDKNPTTKYLKKACAPNLTPLRAEFFVWEYMQLELAAEGVYKQLSSFDVFDEQADKQHSQANTETRNNKTISM